MDTSSGSQGSQESQVLYRSGHPRNPKYINGVPYINVNNKGVYDRMKSARPAIEDPTRPGWFIAAHMSMNTYIQIQLHQIQQTQLQIENVLLQIHDAKLHMHKVLMQIQEMQQEQYQYNPALTDNDFDDIDAIHVEELNTSRLCNTNKRVRYASLSDSQVLAIRKRERLEGSQRPRQIKFE